MRLVWLVLLAVLAAFGVSWMIETPVAIDVWVVRRQAILVTGVASFALMSLIVLLSTRPAWLERRLGGLDRMYQVHKRAGFIAIGLGITHYLLELSGPVLAGLVGRPAKGPRIPGALDAFRGMAKELGEWSVWLLAAMLIVTLWRRFPYHLWRHAHRILSLIYLALVFHGVVLMPPAYWSQPAGWLVAACAVIGTVCAVIAASGRIGRGRTFRGVVTAITPMGDQTSDVVCRLQGPWRHRPGQFAFLKCDRWEAHIRSPCPLRMVAPERCASASRH